MFEIRKAAYMSVQISN